MLVSSQEPKARQTLEPTGHVIPDSRFNEQVVARFDAGIKHWHLRAAARPLVVATHGMAMTLWLADSIDLADPTSFWADLRLPDVFEVDLAGRTLDRVVSTVQLQVR